MALRQTREQWNTGTIQIPKNRKNKLCLAHR